MPMFGSCRNTYILTFFLGYNPSKKHDQLAVLEITQNFLQSFRCYAQAVGICRPDLEIAGFSGTHLRDCLSGDEDPQKNTLLKARFDRLI